MSQDGGKPRGVAGREYRSRRWTRCQTTTVNASSWRLAPAVGTLPPTSHRRTRSPRKHQLARCRLDCLPGQSACPRAINPAAKLAMPLGTAPTRAASRRRAACTHHGTPRAPHLRPKAGTGRHRKAQASRRPGAGYLANNLAWARPPARPAGAQLPDNAPGESQPALDLVGTKVHVGRDQSEPSCRHPIAAGRSPCPGSNHPYLAIFRQSHALPSALSPAPAPWPGPGE